MKEKSVKIKTFALSFALVVAFLLSAFVLVGCGNTSLSTVQENYTAMQEKVASLQASGIFSEDDGSTFGLSTQYVVDYGTIVNGYVSSELDNYAELKNLYNSMLVVANKYTEFSVEYILSHDEANLSSEAKAALSDLNESILSYTECLTSFSTARTSLITHYDTYGNTSNPQDSADLMALLQFKKKYGALVESAIDLANCAANVVDSTEFLTLLENTGLTVDDFADLQEYIGIKTVQVFCDVLLTEVANKITWSSTASGSDKARLTSVIESFESMYQTFLSEIVTSSTTISDFSESAQENLHEIFDTALSAMEDFCVEIENFQTALFGLDISTLATTYGNDLSKYAQSNEVAEVYLAKVEQFVTYSLPNFVEYIGETLSLA